MTEAKPRGRPPKVKPIEDDPRTNSDDPSWEAYEIEVARDNWQKVCGGAAGPFTTLDCATEYIRQLELQNAKLQIVRSKDYGAALGRECKFTYRTAGVVAITIEGGNGTSCEEIEER